jgi:hypothetical protein
MATCNNNDDDDMMMMIIIIITIIEVPERQPRGRGVGVCYS